MLSASSMLIPSLAVIKLSFVMISFTGRAVCFWKRKSRFVKIPTNFPSLSITGMPPILNSFMIRCASPKVELSFKVTGSMIIPDSERFTLRT